MSNYSKQVAKNISYIKQYTTHYATPSYNCDQIFLLIQQSFSFIVLDGHMLSCTKAYLRDDDKLHASLMDLTLFCKAHYFAFPIHPHWCSLIPSSH